jgi:hypothetical protein
MYLYFILGKDASDPVEYQMIALELDISDHLMKEARDLIGERYPGAFF